MTIKSCCKETFYETIFLRALDLLPYCLTLDGPIYDVCSVMQIYLKIYIITVFPSIV